MTCTLLELVNIGAAMIGDETHRSVRRDPGPRHHWARCKNDVRRRKRGRKDTRSYERRAGIRRDEGGQANPSH